ncbi:MAG: hypothetical protein AB8B61_09550 [Cyclobacteriaceae bacterium]
MKTVFILQHSYDLDGCDETKLIGVYSTKHEAENAVHRLREQEGFKRTIEGFEIDEYEINKDHWTEGFITLT